MGEAEDPTGYLVGGTQQTPTPLYLSIPCPPETLGLEEGHGVGKISLFSPPTWSPEGNRRVEISTGFGNQKIGAHVLAL